MDKSLLRLDIWRLLIAAAVMRIGYLLIAITDQGLRGAVALSPDSTKYLWVAEYIQTGAPELARWLFQVGPGFGLILACVNTLDPFFCDAVQRTSSGLINLVDNQLQNIGAIEASGYDVGIRYATEVTRVGQFDLALNATLLDNYTA